MSLLHDLYHAAVAADEAWQHELESVYGKDAGDARYDRRGTATPRLRVLHEAFHTANDARHAATMAAQ